VKELIIEDLTGLLTIVRDSPEFLFTKDEADDPIIRLSLLTS
jgi:hypothetical protein